MLRNTKFLEYATKAKSKSSGQWLSEHFQDEYVRRARREGLRSRATFKLKEINERDHLFKSGDNVIDLGAAPGGWTQYAAQMAGPTAKLIALDRLPMEDIPGVTFIQGDFGENRALESINNLLAGEKIDIILSDMAPNISGIRSTDQARAMNLAELALDMANDVLAPGGVFLVKLFQGDGFNEFHKQVQQTFKKVVFRKPKASRPKSREVYLLARGFKYSK